jgi:hypothetical protein
MKRVVSVNECHLVRTRQIWIVYWVWRVKGIHRGHNEELLGITIGGIIVGGIFFLLLT